MSFKTWALVLCAAARMSAAPAEAHPGTQTDPPSAAITFGDEQVIALAVWSGSGTRYSAPDVEFREHQGQARVTWGRASFTCKPAE